MTNTFIWCSYRNWSFNMLCGLLDLDGWEPALIVTTQECQYDFSAFEALGIAVLRDDPRKTLQKGGRAYQEILSIAPQAIFHNGWSWMVPDALLAVCPNVTLHPGKLPRDRGGSPIQNQIRNGENWTYANLLKMSAKLDDGPVYARQRIPLDGDADDVWARMTATGVVMSRRFLEDLGKPGYAPSPQATAEPTFYKRVQPMDAELKPGEQTALQMHNIIRCHSETDPNSYVVPAYFAYGDNTLVVDRSSLGTHRQAGTVLNATPGLDPYGLASEVNNGERAVSLEDGAGDKVFLDRFWIR